MREVMLFRVGSSEFALDLKYIKGVHRSVDLPDMSSGTRAHRPSVNIPEGGLMPFVDLCSIFKSKKTEDFSRKVMYLQVDEGPLAVQVDQTERVLEIEEGQIALLPPVFKGRSLTWFPHVLKYDQQLILLLSPDGMAADIQPRKISESEIQLETWLNTVISEQNFSNIMVTALRRRLGQSVSQEIRKAAQKLKNKKKPDFSGAAG
jgi:chemotaxis signal transduction protein